jgi:hypothetical protein
VKFLVREQFPDLAWDAADLDAAAEFWLRLYERAAPRRRLSPDPEHALEVRLRGFPRHRADDLADELHHCAGRSDLNAPRVGFRDPDTLTLSSRPLPADRYFPPAGLGLPLLAGEPFHGLCAEVRFRVVGTGWRGNAAEEVTNSLVVVGELRGGLLVVKAAWRSGSPEWVDELAWGAPPARGMDLLAALDEFRRTDRAPGRLARRAIMPAGLDRRCGRALRVVFRPVIGPRLGWLAPRCGAMAAYLAALGLAGWRVIGYGEWWWLIPVVLTLWPVVPLLGIFAYAEWWFLIRMYRLTRRLYDRLHAADARPVEAAGDAGLDNPWVRKYTAELEAAGFARAGDLAWGPAGEAEVAARVFLAPDGVTYLAVSCLTRLRDVGGPGTDYRLWPGEVWFGVRTFFPDGQRVESTCGRSAGFLRVRGPWGHRLRVFPEVGDPVELAHLHAAEVVRFAAETGQAPLRHESFDGYVRRAATAHDEEQEAYAGRPYAWRDHLRWYFQWPRAEYRG